jgi:phage head maturation protease
MVKRQDVTGCSFGFICDNDNWLKETDGTFVRTVLSATIIEMSVCPMPAYPSTSVMVRSLFPDGAPALPAAPAETPQEENFDDLLWEIACKRMFPHKSKG